MKVPIGPGTAVHILSITPSGIEWNFLRTRHIVLTVPHLNSSLMMSLGAGACKVRRGPNAISREEVSMAILEAGTTPRAATNRHRHTE